MFTGYKLRSSVLLFLLRNAALYFLMINAFLHASDILNPLYLSIGFMLTALAAAFMERLKLRFWITLIGAIMLPFIVRMLVFFLIHGIRAVFPGHEADLLFLFFDKDFFPFLLVYAVVWLFNFLARRYPRFISFEILLNCLLLIAVFWNQAFNHINLYPHPSYFALALMAFVLCEIFVLLTAGVRREQPPGNRKKLLSASLSLLWLIIPLLIVFYLMVQGYHEQSTKSLSGLMKPTLFQFDLSQYVELQSEIELSDDLVLLMRTDGPRQKYLLRRYILSSYDPEKGFFRENRPEHEEQYGFLPDYTFDFPDPRYLGRRERLQEYYLINFDTTALIALNYPVKAVPFENWHASSFARVYRVISKVREQSGRAHDNAPLALWHSLVRRFTESDLHGIRHTDLEEKQKDFYTDYAGDQKIKRLAETLTSPADGLYNKAVTIYEYLKQNFYYSLKPGVAERGNQLHHFLFRTKKGYCSYFAFAMALLCRSIDIPARVVVGFYVGPQSQVLQFYHSQELLDFYEVRAYQAHAWVEIYCNQYGWIEFDPTSTTLAPGEDFDIFFGRTGDEADLKKLIEEILKNQKNLRQSSAKQAEDESFTERIGKTLMRGLETVFSYWYFVLPAAYLVLVLLSKCFPYLLFLLAREKTKKIKLLFSWCMNLIYGPAWVRFEEESLLEYAKRLGQEKDLKLHAFTEYYLKCVFSTQFNTTDYKKALTTYREFVVSWRKRSALVLRLLAFLNPRFLWRKKL